MKVPTGVLAYKVLKNAELSNEKQQLTQELKAIFDSYTSSQSSGDIDVKFAR